MGRAKARSLAVVTVKDGHRVINVKCANQDVIALSGIHFESYTMTTGEFERLPSEDNETNWARNV